jgi:hypothetical protein
MHKDLVLAFLNLYNPLYINKMQRLFLNVNFRGSAKSTIITMIIPAYIAAHNGQTMKITDSRGDVIECQIKEGLVVIVSETGQMAEDFVVRIRDEFTVNPRLRYFYGFKIRQAMDSIVGQWTRRAFKMNDLYILGVGVKMQIRGRIKGASRPTLLLCDDLYSENNVLTEDTRRKIRHWFNAAAANSVDDLKGKIMVTGTILHEDTVLVDLMKNKLWKKMVNYLMPVDKFRKFIKEHLTVYEDRRDCRLPFDEVEDEYDRIAKQTEYFEKLQKSEDWELAWEDRTGLYYIALKYQETILNPNSTTALFYQEYFHVTVSEENKAFKGYMFQKLGKWSVQSMWGATWLKAEAFGEKYIPINIEIGIDTATGRIDGDDTVITVGGRLPDGKTVILLQVIGKYPMRDSFHNEDGERFNMVMMDREYVKKIGWMDEAFRLAQYYGATKIKIGYAGSETDKVELCRQVFEANKCWTTVMGIQQTGFEGQKHERIINNLLPHYQTMRVWHAPGLDILEGQLEFLGGSKFDDAADSNEVLFKHLETATNIDYNMYVEKKKQTYHVDKHIIPLLSDAARKIYEKHYN